MCRRFVILFQSLHGLVVRFSGIIPIFEGTGVKGAVSAVEKSKAGRKTSLLFWACRCFSKTDPPLIFASYSVVME